MNREHERVYIVVLREIRLRFPLLLSTFRVAIGAFRLQYVAFPMFAGITLSHPFPRCRRRHRATNRPCIGEPCTQRQNCER